MLQSTGLCPAQRYHQFIEQETRAAQGRCASHGGAGDDVAGGNQTARR